MLLSVIAVIPPQLLSMFNVNIYVSSAQPAFWGTSDPLVHNLNAGKVSVIYKCIIFNIIYNHSWSALF